MSEQFLHYCFCPTVRDWIAMYPALFSLSPSSAFSPLSLPFLSVYHIFSFSLLPHGFSSTFLRSFHCHFCITFLISFFLLTSSASFFFTDTFSLSQPLYVILLLQFLHSSVSFSSLFIHLVSPIFHLPTWESFSPRSWVWNLFCTVELPCSAVVTKADTILRTNVFLRSIRNYFQLVNLSFWLT